MKKTGSILLLCFLLFALLELRYLITDGFSCRKILYGAPYMEQNEAFDQNYSSLLPLFDKKFYYLSKGRQTYVFESADKEYVIKFIRFHKYKLPFWASFFSNFPNFIDKHFQAKGKKFSFVISSYKLALVDLHDSTHVEYLHLNQTNFFNKKIEVIDKGGFKHQIDLDEVAFIIQKKSASLNKTLSNLIISQKKDEVEKIIGSFFDLLVSRTNKRIINIDAVNLIRNFGISGTNIIEQDVGSFVFVGEDKNCLYRNFFNSVLEFRKFLEKKGKAYLPFFDEKLSRVEKCLNI